MNCFFFRGKTPLVFVLFLSVFQILSAEDELQETDVRSIALGSIFALSHEWINPAFLAWHIHPEAGISVYNRFGMNELNSSTLSIIIPNRFSDAGGKLSYFGYADYRVTKLSAGIAKKINSRLSIGSRFSFLQRSTIFEKSSQNETSADLGLYCKLSEKWDVAFLSQNLLCTNPETGISLHTGIEYQIIPSCSLLLEPEWNLINRLFRIKTGFEYEFSKGMFARVGFLSEPRTPSLGIAYHLNSLSIDTSFRLHPNLGKSSAISIFWKFQ